jgi:hypothetical protein
MVFSTISSRYLNKWVESVGAQCPRGECERDLYRSAGQARLGIQANLTLLTPPIAIDQVELWDAIHPMTKECALRPDAFGIAAMLPRSALRQRRMGCLPRYARSTFVLVPSCV